MLPKLPRYNFLDYLSSSFEIKVFGTKLQLLSRQLLAVCLNSCCASPAASHVHSGISLDLELHQFCVWKKPEENSLKRSICSGSLVLDWGLSNFARIFFGVSQVSSGSWRRTWRILNPIRTWKWIVCLTNRRRMFAIILLFHNGKNLESNIEISHLNKTLKHWWTDDALGELINSILFFFLLIQPLTCQKVPSFNSFLYRECHQKMSLVNFMKGMIISSDYSRQKIKTPFIWWLSRFSQK